jgi:hypothetical protein
VAAPSEQDGANAATQIKEDEVAMSKYQLFQHGWPIGQWFVPEGAIIDDVAGTDPWSVLVRARGLSPPPNAQPLTQETYDRMAQLYDKHRIRTIPGGDGIKR